MRMLAIVADLQREPADLGDMPPVPPHEPADLLTLVTGTVGSMAGRTMTVARLGAGAAIRPGPATRATPWATSARRRHGAFRLPDGRAESEHLVTCHAGPGDDPSARHDEVYLDALKKSAKTVGGTVNDAYLAAIAGGLRTYHERHGAAVDSLRALVPITCAPGRTPTWATGSPCSG